MYAKYVITAGHGGSDPGAVGGGVREADVALMYRNKLAMLLESIGKKVLEDGLDKENKPLVDALKLTDGGKDTLFIEFHMNASGNPEARGVECISLPDKKMLSQSISKAVGLKLRGENGWIDQSKSARGRLAVVNKNGIIVELGFISNSIDRSYIIKNVDLICSKILEVIK